MADAPADVVGIQGQHSMLLATNLPFGGIKPSNIGREFSHGAVEAFRGLKAAYIAD